MRGTCVGRSPSPQRSPRKRGEGAHRVCGTVIHKASGQLLLPYPAPAPEMLDSYRIAAPPHRRAPLPRLRIIAGCTAGLIACTALACVPPLTVAPAHAQKFAAVKKKSAKKTPAAKASPKEEQQARPAFTPQDEASAAIAGIADARAWGDSAAEFAKLLPQASGPWLAG